MLTIARLHIFLLPLLLSPIIIITPLFLQEFPHRSRLMLLEEYATQAFIYHHHHVTQYYSQQLSFSFRCLRRVAYH